MLHLLGLTDEERRELLRRAICRKCQYRISEERLENILLHINIRRPYVLKTTVCPDKFLNHITAEYIATAEHRVISEVFPIYGAFRSGYYERVLKSSPYMRPGQLDTHTDAAAVKVSLYQHGSEPAFATYTLILYESSARQPS